MLEKPLLIHRRGFCSLIGLAAAAFVNQARAQGIAVPLPDVATIGLPKLVLSGRTRLTFIGLRVYDAQLWVADGFDAARPTASAFILDLTYLRGLKGKLIAERSLKEMRDQAEVSEDQAKNWLAFMERTFPDVGANDRLLGIHQPGQAVRFTLNGKAIGQLRDDAFAERFFDIWLSPKTSEKAMRTALLAGTSK